MDNTETEMLVERGMIMVGDGGQGETVPGFETNYQAIQEPAMPLITQKSSQLTDPPNNSNPGIASQEPQVKKAKRGRKCKFHLPEDGDDQRLPLDVGIIEPPPPPVKTESNNNPQPRQRRKRSDGTEEGGVDESTVALQELVSRKREQNKRAAKQFRSRMKLYLEGLERKLKEGEQEQQRLTAQMQEADLLNDSLRTQMSELRTQLERELKKN